MRITRPRATKISQITIDTDLDMGAHNIALGAGQTVDGEDVSAHVAAASPHTGHLIVTTGSYTGDGATNRPIAHGLGRVPNLVIAVSYNADQTISINTDGLFWFGMTTTNTILRVAVTEWDGTNFYVGPGSAAANYTGSAIYWIAIG